jgi:hypothetical protein
MSETVEIRRFTAQYRLRPSQFDQRYRLDRLLPEVTGEALELALERAGIRTNEIVCIPSIHVPVRLRLSRANSALVAEWVRLLAGAIADVCSQAMVAVRYRSRSLALVDMGAHIAQERFHYVWAWRQIGFWEGSDEPANLSAGALEFAGALAREPEAAVAVLATLAARGLLRPLLRSLEDFWAEIAFAVLQAAGARTHWPLTGELDEQGRAPLHELETGNWLAPTERRFASLAGGPATRTLERSRILRECLGIQLSEGAAMPLALLALLECEPALVRADSAQLFVSVRAVHDRAFGPAHESSISAKGEVEQAPPVSQAEQVPRGFQAEQASRGLRAKPPLLGSNRPTSGIQGAGEPELFKAQVGLRAEGITDFGGLLFLLHILDELRVPERAVASEGISGRGLAWFQHRLALTLQPLQPDDPAALAFCGLGPSSQHPSWEQPLPSPDEQDLIEAFAVEVREALAEALPEPPRAPEMLMQFVCRRHARIVVDPGWIELRFALRDVSTEIRRAGLDLDPNYVPWLGVVVRFVYE